MVFVLPLGIIDVVRTQNFSKNLIFLIPIHTPPTLILEILTEAKTELLRKKSRKIVLT